MSCRVDSTLIAGACVVGNRGLGVLGATVRSDTATGAHGPGYLYNDWSSGDDAKEFRGLIVTPPSSGTFSAEEDGSFDLTGAPDGSYTFVYRLFVDGADLGTATASITIGAASVTGTVAGTAAFTITATAAISVTVGDGGATATVAGIASFTVTAIGAISGTVSDATSIGEPVTLWEARAQCRIAADDTAEDAMLAIYIQAAREAAEQELGRVLITRTIVQTMNAFPCQALRLQRAAVVAVASVEYRDQAGTWQTLPAESYVLDNMSGPGWLLPAAGTSWPATADMPGSVRITYSAGYGPSTADIPAGVRQWILLNVAAMYAQREAIDASGRAAALPSRFVDRLLDAERLYG